MEAEQSIASSEEVSELLRSLDWDSLWPRMVGHTVATMRRRHRLRGTKEELLTHAHELVEDCLNRVFVTKRRIWNKTHYENAEDFLFDVMDSLISNWLKGRQKKLRTTSDEDPEAIPSNGGYAADGALNAGEILKEFVSQLEVMGAGDDEMLIFNARVYDGLSKPEDIRDDIGMTDTEYHNAVRRLDRRLQKIRAKLDL
jgi:hypothetical protein